MKLKLSVLLALLLTLSLLAGCGAPSRDQSNSGREDGKLHIVTTIFPGYDFTRQIVGDDATVTLLLPPGTESHSFEPTPQDIITIQNCDVFLYVGGVSDSWIKGILNSMDTSRMTVLSMMDMVDVVEEEIKEGMEHDHDHEEDQDHQHSDGDHHEEEETQYDEHVWTSPVNAKRITQAISDTLCRLDESNAPVFRENTEAYLAKLDELDTTFRQIVQNGKRKLLIFGDRFPFRYFVDEYGLDYYAVFPGCSTDTEANAKTVAFLVDKVKSEQIPVVFYLELSNQKMADIICESTGAKKLLFHSCHNLSRDELERGATYLELMEQNAEHLKEALG